MYCYAHHNSDKMLNYYNEDGTLKDNAFTRANPNDYSNYFYNVNSDNVVVEDVVKPWKSDSSKQNKTRRIYLKGKENKGYFEVVKDLEDNNYSVHFKPTDSKNPNAFTQEEKSILFQAVADVIPDGANLSTWGELTKGGIHGLSRFADLGFTKTGERPAKTKAGEDINIPIFTKLPKIQSTLQNKQNNNDFYSEDGKTPLTIYRGYALTEDREAKTLNETVGKTAVDYDETLKGALYFTSSEEEATDYAKSRTDKSPEPPTVEHPEGNRVNRHYTGDYAKVSKFHILSTAKVEHYKDIIDYTKNGRNSTADVIVLDKGTMWSDNTEYVVKNPNVIVFAKEKDQSALQQKKNNNPQDYTMNSGGAYGGDTYWDVIGRQFGLTKINHFRPIDNQNMSKTLRDRNVKPFSITHEQSNYAREQIKQLTGRELPYTLAGELLARDFYQVDKSDGVFAIANITSSQKAVQGGTNMAVQVGIKQGKPVHVYDLNTESWYQYNQSTGRFEVEDTPVLTKSFAGVGTRNIQNYKVNKDGQWVDREGYVGYDKALKAANAIKAVYQKTFNTATTSNTVNIYAGTGENADLSNFAIRPFSFTPEDFSFGDDMSKHQFNSVEQAFQYYKIMILESMSDSLNYSVSTGAQEAARKGKRANREILLKRAQEILNSSSAAQARALGRKDLALQDISSQFGMIASAKEITNSIFKIWDERSSKVMKALIKASFEQNPQAAQRLLDTGNATLTHTQDNGKWGKEFPRLLMEVRDELKKKQDSYKVKNDQDIKDDLKELGKRRQDDCNK